MDVPILKTKIFELQLSTLSYLRNCAEEFVVTCEIYVKQRVTGSG